MIDLLVIGRIVLAGVFLVAGIAKARDRAATRRAFVALGGPERAAGAAAILLPALEIGTAGALTLHASAWPAAGFALGLLVLFTVVLAAQFRKEERPPCACFGSSRPAPVGWRELVRNLALVALAGAIVAGGRADAGPDLHRWLLTAPPGMLAGALALGAALLTLRAVQLRRQGPASHGAEPGAEPAPPGEPSFLPPRPSDGVPVGAPVSLGRSGVAPDVADDRRPVLLLVVSERSPPCRALLDDAAGWERELAGAVDVVRVFRDGSRGEADAELARRAGVRWTPAALLLDERARVATPVQHGTRAVRELVGAIRAASREGRLDRDRFVRSEGLGLPSGALGIGAPAPAVVLHDAAGARRELAPPFVRETALLFWDPGCFYCQQIAPALRRFESEAADSAPQLVFVTGGGPDAAHRSQAAFASPALFDPERRVAPLFGARGTPSAILLDRAGRIGSSVAMGRDHVLALLGIELEAGSQAG